MKHIKLFENKNIQYFSDALRTDLVDDVLSKIIDNDIEYLEEIEEDPDTDMLLDPYGGYEYQTYIQYKNNKIIYWEGWSQLCWNSLYNKSEYKGLSKEDAIKKVINERIIPSFEELNLKYIDSYYWYQKSWDDYIENGYIMKIIFELIK